MSIKTTKTKEEEEEGEDNNKYGNEGPDNHQLMKTGMGIGLFTGIWIVTFGIITILF